MEQHPIPQQITSYEFKLVGDMTLKQFGKAAGGIILALVVNASGIVFFVKWPLMIVLAGGGLLLAFVPFQDRPLETWLMAFIRSVYNPTIYLWKKRADKSWLEVDINTKIAKAEESEAEKIEKKDKGKVEEFIKTIKTKTEPVLVEEEVEGEEENSNNQKTKTKQLPITKSQITKEPPETQKAEVVEQVEDWRSKKTNLKLEREKLKATGKVEFGEIPMPDTPEVPNVLVGMVTTVEGKMVEGAIVEILDRNNNPVRVLKTNALGQFKTTTPLANGLYLLIPEREGFKFDRVEVELTGKIVEPIRVKAIGGR